MVKLVSEAKPEQVLKAVKEMAERKGWAVLVGGKNLVYTAGLSQHGLPELVMCASVDTKWMTAVLDNVAYCIKHNYPGGLNLDPEAPLYIADITPQPVRLDPTEPLSVRDICPVPRTIYGDDSIPFVQVVLYDDLGRYPGDADYNAAFSEQILLNGTEIAPSEVDVVH